MEKVNDRRFLLKLEPSGDMMLCGFDDVEGERIAVSALASESAACDVSHSETRHVRQCEGLSALQSVVGGYIEHVLEPDEVRGRCVFYVNEEGLLRGLKGNLCASVLCGAQIVGNLCVCRGDIPETFFTREEAEAMAMELYEIFMKKMTADLEGGEADEEAEQGEA